MRLARLRPLPHNPGMTGPDESWRPYLDPEEVILWQGRPQPGWSWRAGENGTILLGVFIIGFLLFVVIESLAAGQSGPIGGLIVFAIIGLVIGASGPVAMAMVRQGTWYTLTDRRALIAHWPTIAGVTLYRGVDCYPITEVALVPADLRGLQTVQVARLSDRYTFHDGWRYAGGRGRGNAQGRHRDPPVGFERVTEGSHVAELCRQVQQTRRGMRPDNLTPTR
ncbi:MAG: hypothetical protein JJU24_00925 [Natronohydrobacter sp.]|nr:hypothetical protein [Natronohydrobacter sp.]